ncbi:Phosphatidylinositol N-acetylglucosaminyltransferase subunit Y [Trema orientale]|uniref:Phosphatidylinositol N-acetylglucosaminyltransferase subunit Y n=1 Tax=Trema orientale TaxID=63057 RepID=A0A2P5AF73_TREOI|nr:Phosphatidylinositol N-acetylglucosaminyltransferase subunit Y [Trema orientale]
MVRTELWGWLFITIGSVFFMGFLYTSIVSKFLPPSNNPIISVIQNDWYYCFLVPLTLPVLVVAVYFHWLSMKLFKHA